MRSMVPEKVSYKNGSHPVALVTWRPCAGTSALMWQRGPWTSLIFADLAGQEPSCGKRTFVSAETSKLFATALPFQGGGLLWAAAIL